MRSFNSLPSSVMWFASSAEHAKHLNYTHILEFETKKDIKIIFIQNLFTQFGVLTGKDLLRHPRFQDLLRSSAATASEPIVGYAGCNECEIAIFKEHLLDTFTLSPASPALIEKRNIGYITGGKRRHTRRYRRNTRRRRS